MNRYVDDVLTKVRTTLGAGVVIGGTTVGLSRFPEGPPLAFVPKANWPLVVLEVGAETPSAEYSSGPNNVAEEFSLTIHFCCRAEDVDAHVTIHNPYEYARKGAQACDTLIAAQGARLGSTTGVIQFAWQGSKAMPDASIPDDGLWVHSSVWQAITDAS